MRVKTIIDEDFINYKKPSLFIATCFCDWKCCVEKDIPIETCQNSDIALQQTIDVSNDDILNRYISNPITSAIVIGGLEPFKQFDEIFSLIHIFRSNEVNDDFVIYTGYYPDELQNQIIQLRNYENIIIKYGRFIMNIGKRYDDILGITLSSKNQFAERIS